MLENLYTTKMSANRKTLQNRFSKIRSESGRFSKIMAAVMSAVVAVTMLCATIVMASIESENEIVYEVYNGNTKINLQNSPFIYNDNYYLPLRETLNAFGINDIEYDNGTIKITMPDAQRRRWAWANYCEISLTSDEVIYKNGNAGTSSMDKPPVLKNGTVYVTEHFFSDLIRAGQIPGFRFKVIRDLSPESYYNIGEEVFIGTLEEQERFEPDGDNFVKRIIVDENRNTVAVIPVENQMPDKVHSVERNGNCFSADNYTGLFQGCFYNMSSAGKAVYKNSGIVVYQSNNPAAFIPAVWQINIPQPDLSALDEVIQ
ncbi:MAG: stalk domain-containing protein [bacterium]|nr:stalk domain-containing protein [bacterium]